MDFIDLTGQKMGRWNVIRHVEGTYPKRFLCRCECGTEKEVVSQTLRNGDSSSCGCHRREVTTARNLKHGQNTRELTTPEYSAWAALMARCLPGSKNAANYYDRGIRVCDEWLGEEGFVRFFAYVGPRPTPKHSIDRINNSLGYQPGNVKWSTAREQAINRRSTRMLTHPVTGETMCMKDWVIKIGVSRRTLGQRIDKLGWRLEDALSPGALYKRHK